MAIVINGQLVDLTVLSDSALDAAYAAAFDVKTIRSQSDATAYAFEIADRIQNVFGLVRGFFGGSRFPLYDARQAALGRLTQASNAQTSVANAASNVAATIKQDAGAIFGFAQNTFLLIVGAIFVLGALAVYLKFSK